MTRRKRKHSATICLFSTNPDDISLGMHSLGGAAIRKVAWAGRDHELRLPTTFVLCFHSKLQNKSAAWEDHELERVGIWIRDPPRSGGVVTHRLEWHFLFGVLGLG